MSAFDGVTTLHVVGVQELHVAASAAASTPHDELAVLPADADEVPALCAEVSCWGCMVSAAEHPTLTKPKLEATITAAANDDSELYVIDILLLNQAHRWRVMSAARGRDHHFRRPVKRSTRCAGEPRRLRSASVLAARPRTQRSRGGAGRRRTRCLRTSASCVLGVICVVGLPRYAAAEESPTAVVWYRSGANCPDGADFVRLLARRGVVGRLAEVGDQVQFVVTLGSSDHGGSGRLERQTRRGTVAIRDVTGQSCAQVADALALTLAVAYSPEASGSVAAPAANAAPAADPAHVEEAVRPPSPAPAPAPRDERETPAPDTTLQESPVATDLPSSPRPRHHRFSLGVDGAVASGIAPGPVAIGMAFFAWRAQPSRWFAPTLRVSGIYGVGQSATARGDLETRLTMGRVDGCVAGVRWRRWALGPCVDLEIGQWSASGKGPDGTQGQGLWSSVGAAARLSWEADWGFFEAQGGAHAALTRYEVAFERPDDVVYRTEFIGVWVGLGGGVTIP
jgi:hypothetical protein